MVERGDNTYYSLYLFQDFSEKSPKQKNEHGDTYFFYSIIRFFMKIFLLKYVFVVSVTFSDMFILNINVFLAFIRLT